jgi:S-layer protein
MAITAAERSDILELVVLMFNAAPGANYLNLIVEIYEDVGHNLSALANVLAETPVFESLHPNFQTAEEFAADLTATVGLAGDAFATSWVVSQYNAGVSKAQIMYNAWQALSNLPAGSAAQYVAAAEMLANKTEVSLYFSVTVQASSTNIADLREVVDDVTADDATVTQAKAEVDGVVTPPNQGIRIDLTKNVDNVTGTVNNDTIVAVLDGANSTLTGLDSVDGGNGNDTITIDEVTETATPVATITNVENAIIRSIGDVTANTTTWSGLTSLKVTQATTVGLTAAATTAVDVSGATGAIVVDGGSTVAVAATAANTAVTVGATTQPAGAVTVSHTKQGTAAVSVDGGTDVTITSGGVTTGTVLVGQGGAAADLPSGAVKVASTGAAYSAAADATLGAIAIDGGATVTVTQSATSSAAAAATDTTAQTITQSAVTVDGGAATTTVSVKQDAAVTAKNAVTAVAGVKQVDTVTFVALATGESVTVGGLTFTAAKALTAAQVAAAYANLTAGTTQGTAPATNGVYSGTFGAYSTGAVTTSSGVSTVDATASAAATGNTPIAVADTAAAGDVAAANKTAGVTAVDAVTGVMGVVGGAVTVNGAITGTDVLATVSLDGYGAGSSVTSDALTSLSLANSALGLTVTNTAATTLNLGLNNVASTGADPVVALGGTYTTLNITADGANSDLDITAAGVTALTVAGTKSVDLAGSTLGALKTVTVTGSAGLTIDASGATVTAVNTTGTTGTVTATVDASKATYTGGAGKDNVTLSSTTVSKAVATGGGDDSVTLAAGTASIAASVSGGEGTDTLVMAAADATTVSVSDVFETKIDGFEKLSLQAMAANATVNLANLDDINYVVSAGGAFTLNIDNMASGGTVELTGAVTAVDVDLADATGTSDSLNLVTKVALADVNFGTVDASGIESIALTVTDTSTTAAVNTATLSIADAALNTLTITGNGHLALTTNSVVLSKVDGSAMTGNLTASTNGTVSQQILGGAGKDTLTAVGNGDLLNGGAGADTLIITGNLATLTGGAGADTFNVADATTNVNSYATITDATAGDVIKFAASAATFNASKVTLADTAVFQDFANAAIALTDTGAVSWFQFGGNTYIVQNVSNDASAFTNGTDIIVKLTGTVDLSTGSFSSSADTLVIV